jgi:methionyl-tRNA formyltransferase
MRACFIGTVEFSKQALNKLLDVEIDICGVVTNSQNTINSDYADLRPICLQHGVDVLDTQNINSLESIEWLSKKNPDVIFCFGWSQLIKQAVLNISKMGVIGFHPTLLPLNRGRHPIVWALSLGLDKTGSTFFFMDEGADSGDILSQKIVNIYHYDDAKSLYGRIIETALHQIDEFSLQLINQSFNKTKQDHSKANMWRKRGMKDGEIDFRMSTRSIYNVVRALSRPYVGAHIMYDGIPVTIWEVSEREDDRINLEPGLVLDSSLDKLIVKTYDGAVAIEKHEFKESPKVGEYL